ncbi:hypothetical protein [Ruminococcus sp.]|uniref:hypothetical protein n=1 Tax=Ruminococcus sp. TaxID=41978 RepID=UPI0025F05A16|nr:hypothetical protein [Ruminococcus sp.]MBQ6250455.1 hypothetical protein [Ruminococcus sp.]
MDVNTRIEELFEKEAYLIDILPKSVPQDAGGRYFSVEEYFRSHRSDLDRSLTRIILGMYCFYDMTAVTEEGTAEQPQAEQLAVLLEKVFREGRGFVNIYLPKCDALITFYGGDLYMTVYNISGEARELLSQLTAAEGLFFREASGNNAKE